jgi:shikimate kinase
VDSNSPNLFLVGLMGAGKSTVGRHLAKKLGKRFIDADREIEARTGVPISVIFEIEGESGFRKREADLIEELTQASDIVLATGGGAVLDERSRKAFKARGYTIYLCAAVEELVSRTRHDRNRPLLQTDDRPAAIAELLEKRDPLYREVANLVVQTGKPGVERLCATILSALESSGLAKLPPSVSAPERDDSQ